MTKVTFIIAAHEDHDEEADWYGEDLHRIEPRIPVDAATAFFDSNPLYEVIFEVEYDTNTKDFNIVSADTGNAQFVRA
jgi:hypothetical protein